MVTQEIKNAVRSVCNGTPCCYCSLFKDCIRFSAAPGETYQEYEERFYLAMYNALVGQAKEA